MPDEPMTLIERLRNPEWVNGPGAYDDAILSTEQTVKDMREAAAENEMFLAAIKMACGHLEDNSEDKAYRVLKTAIASTVK